MSGKIEPMPYQVIAALAERYAALSDAELLAGLSSLAPLADESDSCWDERGYWNAVAYPYLAFADVAARRRLVPAIPLLLERACFGDPGEIMRGLRHSLEAIVNPDWSTLATFCIEAASSARQGTQLWALDQLAILDDPRAEPVFRRALAGPEGIRSVAQVGLERLGAS